MTVTPGRVPVREGQTFGGTTRLVKYANFVKLPHTVFALPFALVGVTLASYRAPVTLGMLGWVILAFTCARFTGMGFNRIVDREIDARNPRTSMREIPSGAMTVREATVSVAVASAIFVYSAWSLNPLCAWLSPVALAWVCFYSYTKRFTRWSHLVLGVGMSIAPVGGYLAVTGAWPDPFWMPLVLSLAVTTWGGGFDILYALQDEAFDRAAGLRSIPAAFGTGGALWISRGLHAAALVAWGRFNLLVLASPFAWLGWLVVAGILVREQWLVRDGRLDRIDEAFFTLNSLVGLVFFAGHLLDLLVMRTAFV